MSDTSVNPLETPPSITSDTIQALLALSGTLSGEQLTPDVIAHIRSEILAAPESAKNDNLEQLDALIQKANMDVKRGLEDIRSELVQGSSYSLDGLKGQVTDPKVLSLLGIYQQQIASDLSKIYPGEYEKLSMSGKNTVELVFWNILISRLSLRGAISMGVGSISSFTEGLGSMFQGGNGEATPSEENIITAVARDRMAGLSSLGGSTIPEASINDIEETLDMVDRLLGTEAQRLKKLFEVTQDIDTSKKTALFENPVALNAILTEGNYTDNGYNVDIEADPIKMEIPGSLDLETIQTSFLGELGETTGNLGGSFSRIQQSSDSITQLLASFGMDESTIDQFKTTLCGLPIIGGFFSMVFQDTSSDFGVLERVSEINTTLEGLSPSPVRNSLEHLSQTFLPKYIEDSSINTPLHIYLSEHHTFSPDFFAKVQTFLEIAEDSGVKIGDSAFWEKILTGKNISGQEEIIYTYIQETLESPNFSEETLIEVLSKIDTRMLQENDTEVAAANISPTEVPVENPMNAEVLSPASATVVGDASIVPPVSPIDQNVFMSPRGR